MSKKIKPSDMCPPDKVHDHGVLDWYLDKPDWGSPNLKLRYHQEEETWHLSIWTGATFLFLELSNDDVGHVCRGHDLLLREVEDVRPTLEGDARPAGRDRRGHDEVS